MENGLPRELNPGPLAPEAKIIPLDHLAIQMQSLNYVKIKTLA